MWVPVSAARSRMKSTSSMRTGTVSSKTSPLIVTVIVVVLIAGFLPFRP